jgi:hypothetical protein
LILKALHPINRHSTPIPDYPMDQGGCMCGITMHGLIYSRNGNRCDNDIVGQSKPRTRHPHSTALALATRTILLNNAHAPAAAVRWSVSLAE